MIQQNQHWLKKGKVTQAEEALVSCSLCQGRSGRGPCCFVIFWDSKWAKFVQKHNKSLSQHIYKQYPQIRAMNRVPSILRNFHGIKSSIKWWNHKKSHSFSFLLSDSKCTEFHSPPPSSSTFLWCSLHITHTGNSSGSSALTKTSNVLLEITEWE